MQYCRILQCIISVVIQYTENDLLVWEVIKMYSHTSNDILYTKIYHLWKRSTFCKCVIDTRSVYQYDNMTHRRQTISDIPLYKHELQTCLLTTHKHSSISTFTTLSILSVSLRLEGGPISVWHSQNWHRISLVKGSV